MQVEQAHGAPSAQLLLQLEAGLLLGLMVLQLTSSTPDSYPGATAARGLACQLCNCTTLYCLWGTAGLHRLPWPAAYTGPQLALQLQPLPQQQHHQQQQKQQEQQGRQPAEWCVLAPSAPLLTELLQLLTRHCLTQLQRHQQQQDQRHKRQLKATHTPTGPSPSELLLSSLKYLTTLLLCSVVPAPGAPAAAAAAAAGSSVTAAAQHYDAQVTHSCVLHTQGALLPHAHAIISIFEAAMRCDAMRNYTADSSSSSNRSCCWWWWPP